LVAGRTAVKRSHYCETSRVAPVGTQEIPVVAGLEEEEEAARHRERVNEPIILRRECPQKPP